MAQEFGLKPALDQGLGNAPIDLIEIFDHPSLNRPFAAQLFGEVGKLACTSKPRSLIGPNRLYARHLRSAQILGIRFEVIYARFRVPDRVNFRIGHACRTNLMAENAS